MLQYTKTFLRKTKDRIQSLDPKNAAKSIISWVREQAPLTDLITKLTNKLQSKDDPMSKDKGTHYDSLGVFFLKKNDEHKATTISMKETPQLHSALKKLTQNKAKHPDISIDTVLESNQQKFVIYYDNIESLEKFLNECGSGLLEKKDIENITKRCKGQDVNLPPAVKDLPNSPDHSPSVDTDQKKEDFCGK